MKTTFDFQRFLNVGRWDLTINRKFYTREAMITVGCILLPIIFKYLMLLGKFHLFNAAGVGAIIANEGDVMGFASYYFIFLAASMVGRLCHTFHNLTTRQGRISELTLPASNLERFVWHVLLTVVGSLIVFLASVCMADLAHVILGWAILGQTSFCSLTLATLSIMDFEIVEYAEADSHLFLLETWFILFSLVEFSSYVLSSAWKYRHTFGYALLVHVALFFSLAMLAGFMANIVSPYALQIVNFLDSINGYVVGVLVCLATLGVLVAVWWLAYRLYCRAQITTKSNP